MLYYTIDITNIKVVERDNISISKIRQNIKKEIYKGKEGSSYQYIVVIRHSYYTIYIYITY